MGSGRPVGAGDVEERRQPRPAALAHDLKPLDDEGAVETGQRYDVRDGGERHEIERRAKVGRLAALPEAGVAQGAVQRDERHEDDPGGREMAEAREIVLPVGIDDGERPRQRLRRLMMVEGDRVEAEAGGVGERLMADRAAVDRDEELRAGGGEARDSFDIGAVAFGHAVGDVDDRLAAAGAEIPAEESGAAGAVDVVVAEDGDPLPSLDGALQPLGRRLHVAQDEGVGHELAQRRIEIALGRLRRDAAPRQHPGDELVLAADLGDGERPQFPGRIEPRPPRPPQRGSFHFEEIAGGCHPRAPFSPCGRRWPAGPDEGSAPRGA